MTLVRILSATLCLASVKLLAQTQGPLRIELAAGPAFAQPFVRLGSGVRRVTVSPELSGADVRPYFETGIGIASSEGTPRWTLEVLGQFVAARPHAPPWIVPIRIGVEF